MPDITIGQFEDGSPAVLRDAHRTEGLVIAGQTGMGKTSLMRELIDQDIRSKTASIVIDPHGDLVRDLLSTLAIEDVPRVLVLELKLNAPLTFGLNLYEHQEGENTDLIVDQVLEVFKKLWGVEQWVHIEYLIRNTARTILASDQPTMADIPRVFYEPDFRRWLLNRAKRPMLESFWKEYDSMRPYERTTFRQPLMNKIDRFLSPEALSKVFSCPTTTVDLKDLMDRGQTLLVRFPVGEVGEETSKILCAVLLQLIYREALKRSNRTDRPRVHLYLDEYGRFATPTTSGLLKEGRKFGIGTTIAFQTLADLDDEENRAAALQVGNMVLFQVIGSDARVFAQNLKVEPELETVALVETKIPATSIVDHLLTHGHPFPTMPSFVNQYIRPLKTALTTRSDSSLAVAVRAPKDRYVWMSRREVVEVLELLDRYFVEAPKGFLTDQQQVDYMTRLAILLSPLVYFTVGGTYQRPSWTERETYTDLRGLPHTLKPPEPVPESYTPPVISPEVREWLDDMAFKLVIIANAQAYAHETGDRHGANQMSNLMAATAIGPDEGDPAPFETIYRRQFAGEFLMQIYQIANLTMKNYPILTGSGQYQEVTRTKPIADSRNKLEVSLATLPRQVAYVQLQSSGESVEGEVEIRNFEWSKGSDSVRKLIEVNSSVVFLPSGDRHAIEDGMVKLLEKLRAGGLAPRKRID